MAACGGTATESTVAAATDDATTASTASTTSTTLAESGSTDGVDLGEDGVLTLEDFIPGFSGYEDIDWRAQELEVQQSVAVCMAAEGFEYIPFVPSDVGGDFGYEEWDEETYVKEYGFGVATWVVDERNFGVTEEGEEFEDPYANDPNMAIVEAMDELERDEYYRLLWGGEPPIISETPQEEIDAMTPEEMDAFYNEAYMNWEPDSCFNDAYANAYNEGSYEAFYEEFSEDLDAVYMNIESDPRILAAQAEWSGCMADKGHSYDSQEDMYAYFYGDEFGEGEFSKAVNELIVYPEWDEEREYTEEEMDDPTFWMPEFDLEELQPYIDEEIAVATANYECSEDMFDLWEEVYNDLQQEFLDENMDRLLAYLEANS